NRRHDPRLGNGRESSTAAGAMKLSRILMLVLLTGLVCAPGLAQAGPKPEFVTFDPPGAGTDSGQGTFVNEITQAGIVGWYADASNANHGFLRTPGGAITTFDAPGAGMGPGQGTYLVVLNSAGTLAGSYFDAN